MKVSSILFLQCKQLDGHLGNKGSYGGTCVGSSGNSKQISEITLCSVGSKCRITKNGNSHVNF